MNKQHEEKLSSIKIGFIGCGGMGTVHLHSLEALSHNYPIEVTAIADITPDHLAKALAIFPKAKGYNLGMDLIDEADVDLIYICLPSYLHAAHAVKALEKGRHVFVEKPLCLSEEDCQALLKAQKDSGKKAMVGQVVRFFPEFAYLKPLVDSKKYGALKNIDMLRSSGKPTWGYQNWFLDEKRSGAVVLDLHIHDSDFLRYLLGEPVIRNVSASEFENGLINHVVTSYDFGKTSAVVEGTWYGAPGVPFISAYRAEFEEATIVCRMWADPEVTVYLNDGTSFVPKFEKNEQIKGAGVNISDLGAYFVEDRYFIESLLNGTPNTIAPLSEGVKSVELAIKELELAHQNVK
jgi:predicted dehydrogenase